MPRRVRMSCDELLALFAERATAPPPEANLLLARYLQCKTSVRLAQAVTEAVRCFGGSWEKCRNCVAFAQFSIVNAIGAERLDLLRRNVEWRLEISDTLADGYFTGDDDPPVGEGNLGVSATCGGAGYFRIGEALDALEQEATGLGAAFYWSLVRSLYRVMRIYDHDDAVMYEEQLHDYIDSDDTANQ